MQYLRSQPIDFKSKNRPEKGKAKQNNSQLIVGNWLAAKGLTTSERITVIIFPQ